MSKIIKSNFSKRNGSQAKTISILKKFQHETFLENTTLPEEQTSNDSSIGFERELKEKKLEAELIVKKAHEEAETINKQIQEQLKNAEQKQLELFEQAQKNGFEEGYTQGQKEGLQSYNELIDKARSIVALSEQQFKQQIEEAEPLIVEIAASLANRIIGVKLSEDNETWKSMLKQLMNEVREHDHIKIYVHPESYELTILQKDELEQLLSHCEHIYIYPDAGLMKNGCIIETKHGRIDASIDRQLNELKAQLLAMLKEDAP